MISRNICNKTLTNIVMTMVMSLVFIVTKTLVLTDMVQNGPILKTIEITSFLMMLPFFYRMIRQHLRRTDEINQINTYTTKLNKTLIEQSHNPLFYEGDLDEGARILTRDVVENLKVDRCSIWLFNENDDDLELDMLYDYTTRRWSSGGRLENKDYPIYFQEIERNPIIVAEDAETHPATSGFKDSYLHPLGIKSMLDVSILFRGETIGVICIESRSKRVWIDAEINFAQVLSSLYSFSWSIADANEIKKDLLEIENFMDTAVLVSKTDEYGRITYVNDKFTAVSGWTMMEAIGQDHKIVNSGVHDKGFWAEMYDMTINKRQIWNAVVTNKNKNGKIYHVDTYIKADFDPETGEHKGHTSIRQDVTEIVELNEKLNGIVASQTSYVLRTDLQGRHTYWNQKFDDDFGWVYEGNMLYGNSLLSICESHHGMTYETVQKCIEEPGKIIKVELDKPHKDGGIRTTLWEFVCLVDITGTPTEIQCMGIDITERVQAEKKIIEVLQEVERKNVYLEHAAKILRHDMHSGINTYIPKGVSMLTKMLPAEIIKKYKLEAGVKLITEGLKHTQKVYKGVYEFTNLVKQDRVLEKEPHNVHEILKNYLQSTIYKDSVDISDNLPTIEVNESLFCTAVDNLIRNGLKYNDSNKRIVKIYSEGTDTIVVEDNGRGLTQEEFELYSKPYTRRAEQKETGTGLGLNICIAILKEHDFAVSCEKAEGGGSKIKIKYKGND